jgi:hypothetical protein
MNRGGTYRARPVDFLLEYGPEKPPPVVEDKPKDKSWQELKFIAQMWVADDHARQQRAKKA